VIAHGGARPGSGRKRKADKFAGPIDEAERRIADRLVDLIDYLFELAEGVTVQEKDRHGNTKVYTRPPDRQAIEYLINRIMGKPTERTELAGQDGGPVEITSDTLVHAAAELEAWRAEMKTRLSPRDWPAIN
jgi:hypothetical protein